MKKNIVQKNLGLGGLLVLLLSVQSGNALVNVASASDDKTVKVWNIDTGKVEQSFKLGNEPRTVAYSHNHKHLASGCVAGSKPGDYTIKIWNTTTWQGHEGMGKLHKGPINAVAFRSDDKRLASASDDGTIKLWAFSRKKGLWGSWINRWEIIKTFNNPGGSAVLAVTYSPDDPFLAAGSMDGFVRIWNSETGKKVKTLKLQSRANTVAYSPNGKHLASGGDVGAPSLGMLGKHYTIKIWNTKNWKGVEGSGEGHSRPITSVAWRPRGREIASASEDGTIKIWKKARDGKWKSVRTFQGHGEAVNSVKFSSDGKYLVAGLQNKTVKIWDFGTGQLMRTLKGHTGSVNSVDWSPF